MTSIDHIYTKLHLPSPLTKINFVEAEQRALNIFVKRDDLIHPEVSGNKWRKLNFNIQEALQEDKDTILTFGGAYSNHLYATAAACSMAGLNSIGLIRGSYIDINNPTLSFAQAKGMKILPILKSEYDLKNDPEYLRKLNEKYPTALMVPEGGNNEEGRLGLRTLAEELIEEFGEKEVELVLAIGTGCTMAGLINSLPHNFRITGINVLKNQEIEEEIKNWLEEEYNPNYKIFQDYHFGGYAKVTSELIQFANSFIDRFKIQLEPIYTAKMIFGTMDLIEKNYFNPGSTVVILHTGGLQGNIPFNQRFKKTPIKVLTENS